MKFYWLMLGVLAVWRVTHFLQAEDGPWEIVIRLRLAVGSGFWGKLLDCFYCLSVWISAPFAWWLGEHWRERILMWLSFSAGASLLERLTAPPVPPAPVRRGTGRGGPVCHVADNRDAKSSSGRHPFGKTIARFWRAG